MPKAEKGSIKDIGKRIKAKGLQKLKYFCQLCEKQCRDANGFKCHIQSESHLRQMKFFSENASGIMDQYSREFEKTFLDTLRMLHGTVQVNANQVYQQVIRDKEHIRMNSTIWATLTDFCQYLGKTGKCRVEENERGWYVTYINRDANQIARQEQMEKREQAEQQAELELQKRMEKQRKEAALAMERAGFTKQDVTNLQPRNEDEVIQISIKQHQPQSTSGGGKRKSKIVNVLDAGSDDDDVGEEKEENKEGQSANRPEKRVKAPETSIGNSAQTESKKRPRDESQTHTVKSTSSKKEKQTNPSIWLYRDIVVRVVDQHYKGGKYFKRKAYVDLVELNDDGNDATAEITLIPDKSESKDVVLRLPQSSLETVVPKKPQDGKVRILRGAYRGKKATVLSIDKRDYQAQLKLSNGTVLPTMNFEDFATLV